MSKRYYKTYIKYIKRYGLIEGTYRFINLLYIHVLIYHWHSRRDKLVAKRKGHCKQCGNCCINDGKKCEHLDENNKCKIYNGREKLGHKGCPYYPLPASFRAKPYKWRNCGYYYDTFK